MALFILFLKVLFMALRTKPTGERFNLSAEGFYGRWFAEKFRHPLEH